MVGLDADLAAALGQVLGLKINMINATFDTIIPGLVSGKYNLGMSSFTDTKERQKTVDFVSTYYVAGTSFYVKAQRRAGHLIPGLVAAVQSRGGEGYDPAGRRAGPGGQVQVGG